jgi:hypothetical protein
MITIRKVGQGYWAMIPHPQSGKIAQYATGQEALDEIRRLSDLWPKCASYDDFIDGIPD